MAINKIYPSFSQAVADIPDGASLMVALSGRPRTVCTKSWMPWRVDPSLGRGPTARPDGNTLRPGTTLEDGTQLFW